MRLIDADKLKENVLSWENCYNGYSDTYDKARIIGEIDEQTTVDAEPIRHGHWIEVSPQESYKCSVCSLITDWEDIYCPNCGAKMDEEIE